MNHWWTPDLLCNSKLYLCCNFSFQRQHWEYLSIFNHFYVSHTYKYLFNTFFDNGSLIGSLSTLLSHVYSKNIPFQPRRHIPPAGIAVLVDLIASSYWILWSSDHTFSAILERWVSPFRICISFMFTNYFIPMLPCFTSICFSISTGDFLDSVFWNWNFCFWFGYQSVFLSIDWEVKSVLAFLLVLLTMQPTRTVLFWTNHK